MFLYSTAPSRGLLLCLWLEDNVSRLLVCIDDEGPLVTGLLDENLSWRAKGLLWYCLARPEGSKIHLEGLRGISTDGRDAIYGAMGELVHQKYAHRIMLHGEGKIQGWVYIIFPRPMEEVSKEDVEEAALKVLNKIDTQRVEINSEREREGGLRGGRAWDRSFPSLSSVSPRKRGEIVRGEERVHSGICGVNSKINIESPRVSLEDSTKDAPQQVENLGIYPVSATFLPETPKERAKRFLPYAERLAKVIKSTKNIKTSPNRLLHWSDEIRKLHESDGVSIDRIKDALVWYKENILGQYTPVVESGEAFRIKFIKLEAAMKREGEREPEEDDGPGPDPLHQIHVGR